MVIANDIAKEAAVALKVKAMLQRTSKTEMAKSLGVNRMTVTRWLDTGDVSLANFISAARALNSDPAEILQNATKKITTAQTEEKGN